MCETYFHFCLGERLTILVYVNIFPFLFLGKIWTIVRLFVFSSFSLLGKIDSPSIFSFVEGPFVGMKFCPFLFWKRLTVRVYIFFLEKIDCPGIFIFCC